MIDETSLKFAEFMSCAERYDSKRSGAHGRKMSNRAKKVYYRSFYPLLHFNMRWQLIDLLMMAGEENVVMYKQLTSLRDDVPIEGLSKSALLFKDVVALSSSMS